MRQGEWVNPVKPWHDTTVLHCAVCGRLIPRRSWVFTHAGSRIISCSPECEDLYKDYILPTYGTKGGDADHQG